MWGLMLVMLVVGWCGRCVGIWEVFPQSLVDKDHFSGLVVNRWCRVIS